MSNNSLEEVNGSWRFHDMLMPVSSRDTILAIVQALNILIKEIRQLKPGFKVAQGYMVVDNQGRKLSALYSSEHIAEEILSQRHSQAVEAKIVPVYWEY